MRLKPVTALLAALMLTVSPGLPGSSALDGAAYAKNDKSEGNGGGNGNGGGSNNGGGKPDSKPGKSEGRAKGGGNDDQAAKGKAASERGKMNGALNANINAVLAHIRNGQTTKGPVGLLAGLAAAESTAATAAEKAAALQAQAAQFDNLDAALESASFASVTDYLAAKAAGTLTAEQIAAIDPLIDAVGGTDGTGLALAEAPPTDAEIAEALAEAAAAAEGVTGAEDAILAAWNKEGDEAALLEALRARLAPHQSAIDKAVAAAQP